MLTQVQFNHYGGADNDPHAPIEYSKFLQTLSSAHGVKGEGIQYPEAISAKRKCLVQCFPPTLDLTDTFREYPSKDFTEELPLACFEVLDYILSQVSHRAYLCVSLDLSP